MRGKARIKAREGSSTVGARPMGPTRGPLTCAPSPTPPHAGCSGKIAGAGWGGGGCAESYSFLQGLHRAQLRERKNLAEVLLVSRPVGLCYRPC